MTECNAIIKANKEIDELKRINKKLNKVCIGYSFKMDKLEKENKQLKFENNELKCALALDEVDYIIADGKKIDIPPYYEFEQRYDHVMHRKEYDGYD